MTLTPAEARREPTEAATGAEEATSVEAATGAEEAATGAEEATSTEAATGAEEAASAEAAMDKPARPPDRLNE
jgi:predicted flap endonuclease-1-like 5' DNA nuclease